jgi:hypothetical protein
METYAAANARLLAELARLGWATEPKLKIPHATNPGKDVRIWFKAQATYVATGYRGRFDFGEARTLWIDRRDIGVEQLIGAVKQHVGADLGKFL